jgi:tRNA nucleotidyltransferase/poly(A) polymerase
MVILTMILSHYKLKSKILADRYNSIIFEKGRGRYLYLVGGYIRDILRGIHSSDRDYVVSGDIKSFVNEIRKIVGGTIVKFKKGNMIRIAFKDGLTFDFSRLQGTLEEDLSKRDFTINAIAWSPEKGIIDPYNGLKDIEQKKIRSISKENLISDPLRMLRAYRFAAELNGSIKKETSKSIKTLNNNIKKVSSERITLELFNLLNSKHSARYLKMALSDNLLTSVLLIPYKMLERNIKEISILEKATINKLSSKIKVKLNKIFSHNLTNKGLLCLELLLRNYFDAYKSVSNIKVSTIIRKRMELVHKGIKELSEKRIKLKDRLFDIFMRSKEAAPDILIIKGRLDLIKDYQRFKRIWNKGLLSSEDIISITDIKTGPKLGKIIIELKRAQFEGRIKSKSAAIEFVRNFRCTLQ